MSRCWYEANDKQFSSHMLAVKLIDLSINRGAQIETLLKGTGIFYQDLLNSPVYLSFSQIDRLVVAARKTVSSGDLGFLLGRRLLPNYCKSASELLLNPRSLGDLNRLGSINQQLVFPFMFTTPKYHQGKTYLIFNNAIANTENRLFYLEVLCSAINANAKLHLGYQVPIHYYFDCKRPRNIYQYEENLGHRLHFNYPLDMVCIDNSLLQKKLLDTSPMLRKQHMGLCRNIRKHEPQKMGLLQQVSQILMSNSLVTLDQVAEKLKISSATLKRKLRSHYTSFQELQDNIRSQSAYFDLLIRGVTNEQAAQALKYNNLANFRRAFKRWTGMTPSQFKLR